MCSSLKAVLGVAMIAGVFTAPLSHAANERRSCGLFLDAYQELSKVAEFKMALRCDGGQKEAFPVNEPLLVGLTATTSDAREKDLVEIEYDFPLQNAIVLPDTRVVMLTFHAQLTDIIGKKYVYGMAWPRSFLQDCAEGRSGCIKFGYALARPASLSNVCVKKDQDGEGTWQDTTELVNKLNRTLRDQMSEDFMCRGSADYRFKFR
jgi:hypothetical protein